MTQFTEISWIAGGIIVTDQTTEEHKKRLTYAYNLYRGRGMGNGLPLRSIGLDDNQWIIPYVKWFDLHCVFQLISLPMNQTNHLFSWPMSITSVEGTEFDEDIILAMLFGSREGVRTAMGKV